MATQRLAPSRLLLSLAVLVAVLGLAPAAAQTNDELRDLLARVDRLERQLGAVQHRLDNAPAGAPAARPETAPSGGTLAPTVAAQLELRITQLEGQLRAMNGRIEEVDFGVRQLRDRLDKLVADLEYRLGGAPGATAGAPPGASAAGAGEASGAQAAAPPPAEAGATGAPPAGGTTVAALPSGSAAEQYRYATSFLRQASYEEAETALRAFIEAHPDDKLTGNARYWLGETYYVRGRYEDAVVTFAEAYQKHPNSVKAPDNLLKLGMSLAQLNKKQEACATFSQLDSKFPKASKIIRQTAAAQRNRLGC